MTARLAAAAATACSSSLSPTPHSAREAHQHFCTPSSAMPPLSAHLPSLAGLLKFVAGTLALSLTAGGAALYLGQCRLIYPANMPSGSRTIVPRPDEFAMAPFDEATLVTPDGVKLRAFVIPYARDGVKPSERPTVLLLHANAGNVVRFLSSSSSSSSSCPAPPLRLPVVRLGRSRGLSSLQPCSWDCAGAREGWP